MTRRETKCNAILHQRDYIHHPKYNNVNCRFALCVVYEGKSMAGMIQLIKEGTIKEGSNVLYVHLGGQPALNAYSSYFD